MGQEKKKENDNSNSSFTSILNDRGAFFFLFCFCFVCQDVLCAVKTTGDKWGGLLPRICPSRLDRCA